MDNPETKEESELRVPEDQINQMEQEETSGARGVVRKAYHGVGGCPDRDGWQKLGLEQPY